MTQKTKMIRISSEVHDGLRNYAFQNRTSITAVVNKLSQAFLKKTQKLSTVKRK